MTVFYRLVLLPLFLLLLGAGSAAFLAYGPYPVWARFANGLNVIVFARQNQWLFFALALLPCVALIGLVVAGKRRSWWLIGLGPVLALVGHHLYANPFRSQLVLENPAFITADRANFLTDEDCVVGLTFNSIPYAYPYWSLYRAPVILQADQDKRMVLLWNAFANRAVARAAGRELRARDLEIVSTPANSLLVFNRKFGQFLVGVTARAADGQKAIGVGPAIPTQTMTWRQWRSLHPDTLVLDAVGPLGGKVPAAPLRPTCPMPARPADSEGPTRIVLIPTTQPIAIPSEKITARPLNLSAGQTPILVFRDPRTGRIRAFDRRVDDLVPRFELNTNTRRKAFLVDRDSRSGWSADGKAIEGPLSVEDRGKKLAPIVVEEGLYWNVMKHWLPELQLVDPASVR